jgi:hypothetical protein
LISDSTPAPLLSTLSNQPSPNAYLFLTAIFTSLHSGNVPHSAGPALQNDLFWVINVLRYASFVKDVDNLNTFYVDRGEVDGLWDELIYQKLQRYDAGWLTRRRPGREWHYMDYIHPRARAQVSSSYNPYLSTHLT